MTSTSLSKEAHWYVPGEGSGSSEPHPMRATFWKVSIDVNKLFAEATAEVLPPAPEDKCEFWV